MPRIEPDTNDILVYPLNDGPIFFANKGTSGSADDWEVYGGPVSGAMGIVNTDPTVANGFNALYIPGNFLISTHNGAGGANNQTVGPDISLSGWVFMRRTVNYFAELFNKQYFLNGWSSPFLTFGFQMENTSDGRCSGYITTAGTLRSITLPFSFALPVGRWCHIGLTWNNTTGTLVFYVNGSVGATNTFPLDISYGTLGNRGKWYVGGIPGSSTIQEPPAIIQDIRVANVTRPQSYFANIFYSGFIP